MSNQAQAHMPHAQGGTGIIIFVSMPIAQGSKTSSLSMSKPTAQGDHKQLHVPILMPNAPSRHKRLCNSFLITPTANGGMIVQKYAHCLMRGISIGCHRPQPQAQTYSRREPRAQTL